MSPTVPATPDWSRVDTVLLDMDGVILDLGYDNHFWREIVPTEYARRHGISVQDTRRRIAPWFDALRGTIDWYCIDYWSQRLSLDIAAIKQRHPERIGYLEGSLGALRTMRAAGYGLRIATNAHRTVFDIKNARTQLRQEVDTVHSAHDFRAAKESPKFWEGLQRAQPFDPARTLFVDDSLAVREAARRYGVAQVWAICEPDTTQAALTVDDGPQASCLAALIPADGLRRRHDAGRHPHRRVDRPNAACAPAGSAD